MTLSSKEIEEFIRNLQPEHTPFVGERVYASTRLGSMAVSSLSIIQALLAAAESDPDTLVQKRACRALLSTVHQDFLTEYPDLQSRSRKAQQDLGVNDASELRPEDIVVPHHPTPRPTSTSRKSILSRKDMNIYDLADYATDRIAHKVIGFILGILVFTSLVCCGMLFGG